MFKNVFKIAGSLLGFMQEGFPADVTEAGKHKQFAAWMRKGSGKINETHRFFVSEFGACAIGTAWIGKGENLASWSKKITIDGLDWTAMGQEFGISSETLREISHAHEIEGVSRAEIANRLEQGYFLTR